MYKVLLYVLWKERVQFTGRGDNYKKVNDKKP